MKKGMLQEIFKKLRKIVDFELLFYAIIIALSFWFIFWTLTLKAGGKENEIQIEETTYIVQSQYTYAPEKGSAHCKKCSSGSPPGSSKCKKP